MICKNCGTEFTEGIFCPECGMRIEEEKRIVEPKDLNNVQKDIGHEESKVKNQMKNNAESELLIAKEKAKAEKAQKERMEIEARTYNGVIYDSVKEARCAREENDKIDLLKQRLETIKNQSERQKVMADFNDEITTVEAKKRLAMLKQKVSQPVPKAEKNNKYVGIVSIVLFIISIVIDAFWQADTAAAFLVLISFGGIIVWFIRKIINVVKSKTRSYYLYIKNI